MKDNKMAKKQESVLADQTKTGRALSKAREDLHKAFEKLKKAHEKKLNNSKYVSAIWLAEQDALSILGLRDYEKQSRPNFSEHDDSNWLSDHG